MDTDERSLAIEGRNPVLEALAAGAAIDRVLIKKGDLEGSIKKILATAKARGIVVQEVAKQKLDAMSETGAHQGVIALCPAYAYAEIDDMLALADGRGEPPLLIVLDGVEDPHNLGAIIRTADCAGAHGVIVPKRRACGMTATVVKAAAGAAAHVPVARVTNIAQTVKDLKRRGVWAAAAEMGGQALYEAPLSGAIALVIGGEGAGVSRLVKETCDFAVGIPLKGAVGSLNASAAAAVLMYEAVRRRV